MLQFSPTTHFVNVSQTILYRGAGLEAIWPHLAAVAAIGLVFFSPARWCASARPSSVLQS